MKTQRKPQETVSNMLDAMRDLVETVTDQMEQLRQQLPSEEREQMPPSPRLALFHAREALKYARGLDAAPHARQRIQSAYRLVCAELGVEE